MAAKTKYILSVLAGFILGAAILYFTHSLWCPNHSTIISFAPSVAPSAAANSIQGIPLSDAEKSDLHKRRYNEAISPVQKNPLSDSLQAAPFYLPPDANDRSYKIDTLIPWKVIDTVHSSKGDSLIADSGFYHVKHISDCIMGRDYDLFVESTPRHVMVSAEHSHPFISEAAIQAFHELTSWIRLTAFAEHDFARGNYTLGIRARVDFWRLGAYAAASIGAENLPVGIDYTIWKQ